MLHTYILNGNSRIIKFYNFHLSSPCPTHPCDKNSSPSFSQISPVLMVPDLVCEGFSLFAFLWKNVSLLSRRKLTQSENLMKSENHTSSGTDAFLQRLGVISLTTWHHAYNLHILKLMIVIQKFYYPYYLVH